MDQQYLADLAVKKTGGLPFPISKLCLHVRNISFADLLQSFLVLLVKSIVVGTREDVITIIDGDGSNAIAVILEKQVELRLDLHGAPRLEKRMAKEPDRLTTLGKQLLGDRFTSEQ